ncbi:hypothetical protein DFS34DRAFT_583963 [Phlyctochytrium arcticum]|nr:hypothetical protein DFS34DRAFT_583963 [Phlyctochytrium arcticum]
MPTLWPDPDQTKGPINLPDLLNHPLVTSALALARVQARVPATLLNLTPGVSHGLSNVTYPPAQIPASAACYFPNQCVRTAPTATFQKDYTNCNQANTWGLTYDDGPSTNAQGVNPSSEGLLDQLKAMNVSSTWFIAGSPAFYNPAALARVHSEGHELAVHTWNHPAMTSISNVQVVAEIMYTEAWIVRTTGVKPRFFRPPYGDLDDRVRAIIAALGYYNILWAFDSLDSHTTVVNDVVNTAKSWFKPQPGFIALEHTLDAVSNTMSIDILKEVGNAQDFPLKLIKVSECIGMDPYVALSSTDAAGGGGNSTTTTPTTFVPSSTATAPSLPSYPAYPSSQPGSSNDSGNRTTSGADSSAVVGGTAAVAAGVIAAGAMLLG